MSDLLSNDFLIWAQNFTGITLSDSGQSAAGTDDQSAAASGPGDQNTIQNGLSAQNAQEQAERMQIQSDTQTTIFENQLGAAQDRAQSAHAAAQAMAEEIQSQ